MIVLEERETEAYAWPPQAWASQEKAIAPEGARSTTGWSARKPAHGPVRQVLWRAITRALVHEPMLRMRQVGLGGY
jgi:hypothetical protein